MSVVPFQPSSTSALLHQAFDPMTDAAVEIGRARVALRDYALLEITPARERYRIYRQLEACIQEFEATKHLIYAALERDGEQ